MGWTFCESWTPIKMAQDTKKGWDAMRCVHQNITHEEGQMILWSVMEYTAEANGYPVGHRWIMCSLFEQHEGAWGRKDLDETCGPFYYSCPRVYLNMAPPPDPSRSFADGWRDKVLEYHAAKAA